MLPVCVSRISRAALLAGCLALLGTNGLTRAAVVPVQPADFGASAVVETFENIVNVLLPREPIGQYFAPYSYLPATLNLPSGAVFGASAAAVGSVFDWSQVDPNNPGQAGWGLSVDGGAIDSSTPLPSGTSFLALRGNGVAGQPPTAVTFTFAEPVQKVGAYVEAAKFLNTSYLDGVATLKAFDSAGNSLGQLSVVTDGAGWNNFVNPPVWLGALDTWIGLGTADGSSSIASIQLQGWSLVADDLMFAVPEPTSVATILLGLALVLRRR